VKILRAGLAAACAVAVVAPAVVQAASPSSGLDDALAGARAARPSVTGQGEEVVRLSLRETKRDLRADVLELPDPDGGTTEFAVEPLQSMEPRLAAEHPELRSYVGRSVEDPSTTVAVSVTPLGVSASVRGDESWVVEPAAPAGGARHVVSPEGADAGPALGLQEPLVSRRLQSNLLNQRVEGQANLLNQPDGPEVVRRTYRLALLNDPTYAAYFGSENVLAAKVALVTRLNQIYNDDLGIRFLLVDDTEELNLDTEAEATGADGPCGANPCFEAGVGNQPGMLDRCDIGTLGRARLVLGNLIGASAYDVGHVMLGADGGGVAWLGVAGRDYAAGGCTGLAEPRGDFFYVDYVAHELGHQFAAQHTFNGAGDFCGANGSDASVEPGSGSSIMAYAGICGADDLQPHTDPYFSQHTIGEIGGFVGGEAGDLPDVTEVQQVTLSGFDTDGDTVTLTLDGRSTTLTRGPAYDRRGVQDAITALVGSPVRIARWDYDPYLGQQSPQAAGIGQPSDAGFQIVYGTSVDPDGGGNGTDRPELVAEGGPGVEARVVEVARGGEPRSGGAEETSGNQPPTVTAPKRKTIPVRTPFRLTGAATDPDGDALTFSWEQDDPGVGTALFDNRKVFGPLFRQFGDNARVTRAGALESPSPGQNSASSEPTRWFPDLEQVLRGRTNAATGRCPAVRGSRVRDRVLDCYSEFLPTEVYRGGAGVGRRTMHFRLTARDAAAGGGGTGHADVALRVRRSAGPFLVRSQRTGRDVAAGSTVGVRWGVNGTRDLAKKVRILLSTDDGATWGTVLANNTRNNGKRKVRIPDGITADSAWVMVEARGNYFYDVSDEAFAIR
jgi:hypothetical protein